MPRKTTSSERPSCGDAGDLGTMQIYRIPHYDLDFNSSCNFCPIRGRTMFAIRGMSVYVRICESCLKKIKEFDEN